MNANEEKKAEGFVRSGICRILLDFAADLSKTVNVAADVQHVIQRVFACLIYSGQLRDAVRII
jgi:hypothetical protein